MLTAKVTLFGRATTADDFAELWSETAEVGTGTVSIRPNVPAEAAGWELEVSVRCPSSHIKIGMFVVIETKGTRNDSEPKPRFVREWKVFSAWAGQERRKPFTDSIIALCQSGTPQAPEGPVIVGPRSSESEERGR